MTPPWETEKKRVDKFEPEIKRILGEVMIATADIRRDQEEATDLMVLDVHPFAVGCRVRRFKYLAKYSHEFTIRRPLRPGMRSEIDKIVDGWCDYLFYGFADVRDTSVVAWTILSLKVLRSMLIRNASLLRDPKYQRKNVGEDDHPFYVWPLSDPKVFPPELVVSRKQYNGK
jgi:hypothetical protein